MLKPLAVAAVLLAPAAAAAQVAPEPDLWRHHHGFTVDAAIGIGSFRGSLQPRLRGSQQAFAGPSIGVGWFLGKRVALGVRGTSVIHRNAEGIFLSVAFAGPAVQYWLAPYVYVGAGAGVGRVHDNLTYWAVGTDARVGLAFNTTSKHTFDVTLELTPVFANGTTYTGLSLLAGYQLL
jgi:hypothetical protein